MSQDWEFFTRPIDAHPAMVFVDLGLVHEVPEKHRPWLLRVRVRLCCPNEQGLSDRLESETLDAIEDELFQKVSRERRARYVGRITTQGHREHFFYASQSEKLVEAVADAMTVFSNYGNEATLSSDPEWKVYRELLYPGELDLILIRTRRKVEELAGQGDDGLQPREVDHWLYFPTAEARAAFIQQIGSEGFEVRAFEKPEQEHNAGAGLRFGVLMVRNDRVDLQWIDPLVTDLFFRAHNCGGTYEGWGIEYAR